MKQDKDLMFLASCQNAPQELESLDACICHLVCYPQKHLFVDRDDLLCHVTNCQYAVRSLDRHDGHECCQSIFGNGCRPYRLDALVV